MEKNIPNHIAIIMDGNRRWAKERGLLPSLGHLAGAKNIKKLVKHIFYNSYIHLCLNYIDKLK